MSSHLRCCRLRLASLATALVTVSSIGCLSVARIEQGPLPHAPRAGLPIARSDEPPPPDSDEVTMSDSAVSPARALRDSARAEAAPTVGVRTGAPDTAALVMLEAPARDTGSTFHVWHVGIPRFWSGWSSWFRGTSRVAARPLGEAPAVDALDGDDATVDSANLAWRRVGPVRDSSVYTLPWDRLRTSVRVGQTLAVRSLVWPGDFTVRRVTRDAVFAETPWVAYIRFQRDELRCRATPASIAPLTAEGPAARYVVETRAHERGMLVRLRLEVRGASDCQMSVWGRDRARALLVDLYMSLHRFSGLNGIEHLR